jgi:hypothetical protein
MPTSPRQTPDLLNESSSSPGIIQQISTTTSKKPDLIIQTENNFRESVMDKIIEEDLDG